MGIFSTAMGGAMSEPDPKPLYEVHGTLVRETDKAVLFEIDNEQIWFPKSQIRGSGPGVLVITEWIATQKGLI